MGAVLAEPGRVRQGMEVGTGTGSNGETLPACKTACKTARLPDCQAGGERARESERAKAERLGESERCGGEIRTVGWIIQMEDVDDLPFSINVTIGSPVRGERGERGCTLP